MSEIEVLTFDELQAVLEGWHGSKAQVTLMPRDGLMLSRQVGLLGSSAEGQTWETTEPGAASGAIALSVGATAFVVIHRASFQEAYWVSKENSFLIAEHTHVSIGVSLELEPH